MKQEQLDFKNSGRIGYIDYLIPGKILIEMKSKGKSLASAYSQAMENVEDKVSEVVDTLSNGVHKYELSELILNLSNPQLKYGFLLLNGQHIEANLAYKDIYSIAKKSIYIIDNYIGVKALVLLKEVSLSVEVIIFSDNLGKGLHNLEYQDSYRELTQRKIKFRKSCGG